MALFRVSSQRGSLLVLLCAVCGMTLLSLQCSNQATRVTTDAPDHWHLITPTRVDTAVAGIPPQLPYDPYCSFRHYPPHRYYGMPDPSSYYQQVTYIHGQWPLVLMTPNATATTTAKVCLRRDHLAPVIEGRANATLAWPYTDGTNPSVLHMSRVQTEAPHAAGLLQLVAGSRVAYLVAVILKDGLWNAQCAWNDEATLRRPWPSSTDGYDVPDPTRSATEDVRVDLLLLDAHFQRLGQTTLLSDDDLDGTLKTKVGHFDDPRLFVSRGAVHVSFTNGPTEQGLARIGFSFSDTGHWRASVQWGDTQLLCCGRNMAVIPHYHTPDASDDPWHAVSWIDPVTIVQVDPTPLRNKQRRLQSTTPRTTWTRRTTPWRDGSLWETWRGRRRATVPPRRLQTTPSSHIHGTNSFMVPLPQEPGQPVRYLGVGHFHREDPGIPAHTVARWVGHHYTHAFYTLGVHDSTTNDTNASTERFYLTGLSAEFVFAAAHQPRDGHIIQFASGLEYNAWTQQIIVGYGINDCEAALMVLDLDTVLGLLRPVTPGTQVVDYMRHLNATL